MNEQEKLWNSAFGDEYHQRNPMVDREDFWREVLGDELFRIYSVFEPGAGRGDNLAAIREMRLGDVPHFRTMGLDVNKSACSDMEQRGIQRVVHGALLNTFFGYDLHFDLVLTRGFLIHVPEESLPATLDNLYRLSNRYIAVAEYYSPLRRGIHYHGHSNALWADDFAGKLMAMYPDLKLVRYGFKYHMEGGDDLTYFLLEKQVEVFDHVID